MKSFVAILPLAAITSAMPIPSIVRDPSMAVAPRHSAFPQFNTHTTSTTTESVTIELTYSNAKMDPVTFPIGQPMTGNWADVVRADIGSTTDSVAVSCTLYALSPKRDAMNVGTLSNGKPTIFSNNRNRKRSQALSTIECEKNVTSKTTFGSFQHRRF